MCWLSKCTVLYHLSYEGIGQGCNKGVVVINQAETPMGLPCGLRDHIFLVME